MNPRGHSIRRLLLLWLLIPLSMLWLIFGAIAYGLGISLTEYAYDRALGDSTRYIASRLRFSQEAVELDLPPAAEAAFRDDPKDKTFFQVVGPAGDIVSGDRVVPPAPKSALTRDITFRNASIRSQAVRVATMRWPVPEKRRQYVLVQVAETLNERTELGKRILVTIIVPELLTILLAAVVVLFGVRRGLSPLQVVRDAVASRSQSELRPLSEDLAPKEVRPLVGAINDLLRRVEQDIEAQRRFVANAAHQLRTPLAGLKTQTQLALRHPRTEAIEHILENIHKSGDRCARLVHQLLMLAKLEPGVHRPECCTLVDLNAVARNVVEELVQEAIAKDIDIGVDALDETVYVPGDQLTIFEMVFNLVENAVRYTQPGGKVTVRVTRSESVNIHVEDNGPGIPNEERARVFERFYRVLGTGVAGSGLGLSIVREIARAHGASIEVEDGPDGRGTAVIVKFPLACTSPDRLFRTAQDIA